MKEIPKYIDHTLLKAFAKEAEIEKLCEEAKEYGFFSVCVNPCNVSKCHELLKNSVVKVCTVIGFPLGQNATETKVFETEQALKDGAEEIDMVINVAKLLDKDYGYVENEIKQVKKSCGNKTLKVIIETCYLSKEEIEKVCTLCLNAKADFVKTSTGFGTSGASVEVIKQIKSVVKNNAKIKASGGIKTKEFALELIDAGADRIGTSSGIVIVKD
ncbi:MAG: deoxyribose-phosphate aldolase [Clostridia bacterium]